MNAKAQIAAETVVVIGILLVFLATVTVYSYSQKAFLDELTETTRKSNECTKIAMIVSSVYSSGLGSRYTMQNDFNIYFGQTFIALNDANSAALKGAYCNHNAVLDAEKNFNEGMLSIYDTNWKTGIENA